MARVIGVISGKGGVGKTTFSANLAIALSKLGQKVLLIDCNVTTPHLAYYLGSKHYTATINDVLLGRADIVYAPTAKSNVLFIPASEELKDLVRLDISTLEKHIKRLERMTDYDFVVLDSAPGLGREAVSVFRACQEIVFLTTPTIPNLTDVTRCAEVADRIGGKKFHVVLNMVRNSEFELSPDDAGKMFDIPLLGMIPFNEQVMDSAAKGTPVLLDSPNPYIEDSYMEIASSLSGVEYKRPERVQQKPTLFESVKSRLGGLRGRIKFFR